MQLVLIKLNIIQVGIYSHQYQFMIKIESSFYWTVTKSMCWYIFVWISIFSLEERMVYTKPQYLKFIVPETHPHYYGEKFAGQSFITTRENEHIESLFLCFLFVPISPSASVVTVQYLERVHGWKFEEKWKKCIWPQTTRAFFWIIFIVFFVVLYCFVSNVLTVLSW